MRTSSYDAASGQLISRDMTPEEIAAWEAELPAYVPPEPESPYLPLKPYQFWTAVRATGHEADLHAWVDAMGDPIAKSYASAVLEFSLEFRYDHPLMQVVLQVLGLTVEEFQTLWLWALDL